MDIDAIIVAYNKDIDRISSLSTLLEDNRIRQILICDNSTNEDVLRNNQASELLTADKIHYLPMGGNIGLSKAYNRALEEVKASFVCILDDDTPLPNTFFRDAADFINAVPGDIYLPIMIDTYGVCSPSERTRFGWKANNDPMAIPSDKLYGINSCMLIRKEVYSSIRYNEKLKIDFIDYAFLDQARAKGYQIRVMPKIQILQNYFQKTYNKASQLARLSSYKNDSREYFKDDKLATIYEYFHFKARRMKIFIKYLIPESGWERMKLLKVKLRRYLHR